MLGWSPASAARLPELLRAHLPDFALLLGTLAAPFLPLPWAALALLALTAVWLLRRPARREVVMVGLALLVAVTALVAGWLAGRRAHTLPREWIGEVRQDYAELWAGLRAEARHAAAEVGRPPTSPAERQATFDRLESLQPARGRERRALLLLDPDGAAVAWAGEGLLHEPDPDTLPRDGLSFKASWTAVTFLASAPLDGSRRPWRIVAGVSFPTQALPFKGREGRHLRWSLVSNARSALPGSILVRLAGAPTLVIEPSEAAAAAPAWPRPVAWGAIAFTLLSLAATRGLGLAFSRSSRPAAPRERRLWIAVLLLGSAFAAGRSVGLPLSILAALEAGLLVAALGLAAPNPERDAKRREKSLAETWVLVWGAAVVLLLFAAAWGFQLWTGPKDLASRILVDPGAYALRLAWAAAAFGLLCVRRLAFRAPARPRDRWAWLTVILLLAGAALSDHPWAALPLLAAGGAGAAFYAGHRRLGEGMALPVLLLVSVLAAVGSWEVAYRLRLREYAGVELLDRLAPPSSDEIAQVQTELKKHFAGYDLSQVLPRSPGGLERQDLAFALWRDSPLARPHSLSSVVVEPYQGETSSFSFGMPVELTPEDMQKLELPLWEESLLAGTAELRFGGNRWGRVRYRLLLRPGFQLDQRQGLGEVEAGLLKGGAAASPVEEIAAPAFYALYLPDGTVGFSPWEEAPPLSARLRRGIHGGAGRARGEVRGFSVETPSGPAWAYSRTTPRGWEVIYLPQLTPLDSLERTADAAIGTLFLLALAAPLVLLPAFPRAAFREGAQRVLRSYSKRLLVVYTVLLLLPLLLLSVFLVQAMEQRLEEEQRAEGEAALTSAQKVLGELIATAPPGFSLDTELDDELLSWLSAVVHHEVNLYWGSDVYASTKHELFTAGLLPRRIPGEIYSNLVLRGFAYSSRTNRAGDTAYLELYAPLRVPGEPRGEERLFISVPLLAQQEEAARDLAHMRRHGVLVAMTLFILLVAVGTRLARNFTRPLMQLIEGTRRIAGGAPSLDLTPTDLELAALVAAVDEMARRIAEGRERLVREKQVVERMVDSITSGVVSLDGDRRVLMRNRVAAELLEVEVGESLDEAVERSERLAPVAAFLRDTGNEMARETVRLSGGVSGDASGHSDEREWSLVWVPLPGAGEPTALLVVEDATEVLRGQRLLAWAEMARMIAHEIKNPLTPIRLSAEHMREVYKRDPGHFDRVFERCTSNILTQVEELRSIAAEFSAYSAIPRIDPQPGDLTTAIAELVEGYRAAPPDGVRVELETNGPIPTRFDAKLLGRAVRNLLENALRATSTSGGEVRVRVERHNGTARIDVIDSGPGVQPDLLPRIFDPYFSTHDTGTGLGLPIARRIAEEHGGDITARNRAEGGLEVSITLPLR